jgi:hypothetical protein
MGGHVGRLVEAIVFTRRKGRRIPGNKVTIVLRDTDCWVHPGVICARQSGITKRLTELASLHCILQTRLLFRGGAILEKERQ